MVANCNMDDLHRRSAAALQRSAKFAINPYWTQNVDTNRETRDSALVIVAKGRLWLQTSDNNTPKKMQFLGRRYATKKISLVLLDAVGILEGKGAGRSVFTKLRLRRKLFEPASNFRFRDQHRRGHCRRRWIRQKHFRPVVMMS